MRAGDDPDGLRRQLDRRAGNGKLAYSAVQLPGFEVLLYILYRHGLTG